MPLKLPLELISKAESPIRLDRYLRNEYKDLTQGIIEKSLRKGLIKLNSHKAKSSDRVLLGDIVTLDEHLILGSSFLENRVKVFSPEVKALAKKIISDYLLYPSAPEFISQSNFIAIDKPHGLAVQGGSKIRISIDDALQFMNQEYNCSYKLVHRLDKDTSGVLLIACNTESARKLGVAFQSGMVKKTYLALVAGYPNNLLGTISNYIGKERSGKFEIVKELDISQGGKLAVTNYKVLETFSDNTLIEFTPQTGRLHQLRFHSKFLGCPIIGDLKYNGPPAIRMYLHAQSINIPEVTFGFQITVNAKKLIY